MTYYILTVKGDLWFAGKVPDPRGSSKVLNALAGLIKENNVPRTPEQITHITNLQLKSVQTALDSLAQEGYVVVAKPPQPIEKTMTPKLRIRPIEEIAAAEIRAEEARRRYDKSPKGKLAHHKFEHSDKGKVKNKRYWGNRGRLIRKTYRIRRNIKSMIETNVSKAILDEERAELAEAEEELRESE